jgi:hypothetical protein
MVEAVEDAHRDKSAPSASANAMARAAIRFEIENEETFSAFQPLLALLGAIDCVTCGKQTPRL